MSTNDRDDDGDDKKNGSTTPTTSKVEANTNNSNNLIVDDDLTTSAKDKLWSNIEKKHNNNNIPPHTASSSSSTSTSTSTSPVRSTERGRPSSTSSKMGVVPTSIPPAKEVPGIPEEDPEDDNDRDEDATGSVAGDTKSREVSLPPGSVDGSIAGSVGSTSYNRDGGGSNTSTIRSAGKQKDQQMQQMHLENNLGNLSLRGVGTSTPRTPSALGGDRDRDRDRHLVPPSSASRPSSRSRQPTSHYSQQQSQQGYGSLGSSNGGYGGRRAGPGSSSAAPSRSVSRARGFTASETTSSRGGDDEGDTSADEEESDGLGLRLGPGGDELDHQQGGGGGGMQRSVSQAGHRRGVPYQHQTQQQQQQQREKRDKGEELIRQRQIERRKAKRLASARMVSYSQSNNAQGGGYPDEEMQQGEDVFVQQDQGRYGLGTGHPHQSYAQQQQAGGYSVPSTPMAAGTRSSGLNTPGPERNVSTSGRKRGGTETPGGYFPPFGSIERGGSEWGGGTSASGGDESGGATPLPLGHPHHQQGQGRSGSQAGYGRQGYQDKTRSGRGSKTPRLGPSTPGLAAGFRMDSPSLGPSTVYAGEERDMGVGKAASVIEQVVSELGSGEQREMEMREDGGDGDDGEDDDDEDDEEVDEEGVTVRDRQDAINIEHPFGLPIWKPALYKKSRSITRNAEFALHSIPSAAAERHLLPGNLLWTVIFGWWLALLCFGVAGVIFIGEVIGGLGWRGKRAGGYARTVAGLGWYIGWPFGKYVEGKGFKKKETFLDEEHEIEDTFDKDDGEVDAEGGEAADRGDDEVEPRRVSSEAASSSSGRTVKGPRASTDGFRSRENSVTSVDAWKPSPAEPATERDPLVPKTRIGRKGHIQQVDFAKGTNGQARDSLYGAIGFNGDAKDRGKDRVPTKFNSSPPHSRMARLVGGIFYWPLFILFIAPALITVCLLCWGMVITIPMARLTWALLKHLARGPLDVKFRRAPKVAVPLPSPGSSPTLESEANDPAFTFRRARLKAGQLAPTPGPDSTVLLCIYRAVGMQYYKYTVGGVNIMFVNLLPLVFFTIFDGLVLLPMVEHGHTHNPIIELLASQAFIFILGLASVIPLSYFIGMAVASISAQSSIGMGAVINATFGSVIEIVLYSIALTQGKGKLVEGSIVGSFLAAILLMPGGSMISAAFKRKEQKFNARSAGVTSTMLIMAVIGTLTPTLFYQTYGSFTLRCEGCPGVPGGRIIGTAPQGFTNSTMSLFSDLSKDKPTADNQWQCDRCYYEHPDPATDPFYQDQVKGLMYFCAVILVVSYLIGLWFSLRTHASQIWQNPQQLMKVDEIPAGTMHPAVRASMYQRLTPQALMQQILPTARSADPGTRETSQTAGDPPQSRSPGFRGLPATARPGENAIHPQRKASIMSEHSVGPQTGTPSMRPQTGGIKDGSLSPMKLPNNLTPEDFTRAVAAATVSALRQHAHATHRKVGQPVHGEQVGQEEEEAGGHEGPSWSRMVSAGVLMACTVLYAAIAEILVDVVDVVLQGSGIDEKFLGITLFALVPNTTEFMNAFSFALNGNIALSMEIGSAYALQVCLLQIPAMVAFSAFYDPGRLGEMVDTFTLIFPRWDVIAIIFSIFLMTYTYIEARSNYHRGSILVLAYLVLTAGFYFAPASDGITEPGS